MSVRLRIFTNSLAAILVFNAVSMAFGFLLFWYVANPLIGPRLNENVGYIAARYFSLGGIIVLALTAICALWVIGVNVRRVTGPLQRIKRAVSEIRDGNLDYELVVSGNDELSELAAGFEQMRVRLKNSMHIKDIAETERRAMMASVTHDLQTPITSILGYSEGILDGVANTPEKIRDYAAVISKKARSLQLLAEDLSLLNRLENAQLLLDMHRENLGDLVNDIAAEYFHTTDDVKLDMVIEPDMIVALDKEKFARVLINIFQNSMKYKKPEQLGCEVSITLVKQVRDVLLTVSDNGIGIEQGDLPHIFEQFYRADASRSKQSGSGLGLSIARRLVQLHGGKIWAISNKTGGISVNITLPLTRNAED